MSRLCFYFDYLSPYAYLAHTQLALMTREIDYRPFDIRSLMPAVGNVPTSVICRPKNRYVHVDLQRWVAHYGVPFERNAGIAEIESRRLLRATLWASAHQPVGRVVTALFTAMWGDPKPLQTAEDVAEILRGPGVDAVDLASEIDDLRWDSAVAVATDAAAHAGVFGAPTIFVDDDMFFGNDRLEFVRAALVHAS